MTNFCFDVERGMMFGRAVYSPYFTCPQRCYLTAFLKSRATAWVRSNPTIEGGEDVTNLSPVEDGNDRITTPSGDSFNLITG